MFKQKQPVRLTTVLLTKHDTTECLRKCEFQSYVRIASYVSC